MQYATLLGLLATTLSVAAHGIMTWPIMRSLPQSQQDGYTYDMGAINVNLGPHPTGDKLCNYLPAGPVFTQTLAPGAATVDYNLMNSHQGGCVVYISKDNQKTWTVIGQDKKCGVAAEASSKQGSINVKIPAGEYKAVIRWSYIANNGGQPQEEAFGSCADVIVSAKGSNKHTKYLLLSQSQKSQLPQDSPNYWDQSCKVGALQCGANKAFVSYCISLKKSGGFGGGSSWYQYQCPNGKTCQGSGATGGLSYMLLAVVLLSIASTQVAAHGVMSWPIIRSLPKDQQDGYTYDMGAVNVNLGSHPGGDMLCNYLPAGPVFTQTLSPGAGSIEYNIMNAHQGGCIIYLSQDNQQTWTVIGQDKTCGVATESSSKQGTIPITLPAGSYNAIIRWTYTSNNGGQPQNEVFSSCADVRVDPSGSFSRKSVLLISQSASSELPRDGSKYWDQSCTAGAFQCGGNKAFINQCISLAGWGSSWYQYQCPSGTTCQSVGGVDSCAGSGGVTTTTTTTIGQPSSTTTTTTVAKPSSTTTTTTVVKTGSTTTTTTVAKTSTTSATTSTTTTTTKKATTTAATGGISNGAACTTYGAWACSNGCICSYAANNALTWQFTTVETATIEKGVWCIPCLEITRLVRPEDDYCQMTEAENPIDKNFSQYPLEDDVHDNSGDWKAATRSRTDIVEIVKRESSRVEDAGGSAWNQRNGLGKSETETKPANKKKEQETCTRRTVQVESDGSMAITPRRHSTLS
ncbi:UNVERIFIED_CONTAM: hypothetical protein HDU68_010444 [Siphonaria sp. JEL0065]|nr:hypothetical protein HDU68_010444 [Siphonaria sp. JEL0065]